MSFFTCANNDTNPVHSAAILAAQEEEGDTQLLSTIADFEVNGHSSIDDDETTLWLKYTKWPVTLAGHPLDILSASALRPANYGGDNILGSWSGFDFDSPEADELKLLGIKVAADAMFERALELYGSSSSVTSSPPGPRRVKVGVGHSLRSCTQAVAIYPFFYRSTQTIYLLDKPGFNDTDRSDSDVLANIAYFLGEAYSKDINLAGIIYLHRIIDPRMGGNALKNVHMFKVLCGTKSLTNVVLATTMWNTLTNEEAVLKGKKLDSHANLFHNMPTISNGFSWSPVRLFDMPISPPSMSAAHKNLLEINGDGEVVGEWKQQNLTHHLEDLYIWQGMHPLIEARLRSCLKNQDDHIFLVEPGHDKVNRALLVRVLEKNDKNARCQFLGPLYFRTFLETTGLGIIKVIIANLEKTGIKTEDNYKGKSETCNRKTRDEYNHPSSFKKEGRAPMVCDYSLSQLAEVPMEMRTSNNSLESKNASQEAYCVMQQTTSSATRGERLLSAAKNGRDREVRQLIREGVDIGYQDGDDRTLTSWAAEGGHCGVIKLLLDQYEVGYDSMDNVMSATRHTKPAPDRVVDQFTMWYDSKDKDGRTPLLIALKKGQRDVAILLLNWYETNYNYEPQDKDEGSPLWLAVRRGYEDVAEILVTKPNVLVDSRNRKGKTPLSYAAKKGHEAIVKSLVESGKADVNSKDDAGQTPLSYAAENGHEAIVKFLVESGKADVNSTGRYELTPLSYAARNGHEAIVKFLVESRKADVNSTDKAGQTKPDRHRCHTPRRTGTKQLLSS